MSRLDLWALRPHRQIASRSRLTARTAGEGKSISPLDSLRPHHDEPRIPSKQNLAERRSYAKNRAAILERKKAYHLANAAVILEKKRARYLENPDKAKNRARHRKARKREAEGTFTAADTSRIRKQQRNRCAYCRSRLDESAHLDHIVALSKGGTNWPRNLQWLCAPCNLEKHAKHPEDYARSKGLLI